MSLDPGREKELWLKCNDGDMTAREELIVSYRPLVFWIAGKIMVNDPQLKQDIIQEGMLALINAVDKFEPQRAIKFSTYAYHTIHGRIINLLERSEHKAPMPISDEYISGINDAPYDDSNKDDWIDASNAVSKLDGREREIVSAIFYDGSTPTDIAREKNMDISHVYRLRRSAIAKIRAILGLEGV